MVFGSCGVQITWKTGLFPGTMFLVMRTTSFCRLFCLHTQNQRDNNNNKTGISHTRHQEEGRASRQSEGGAPPHQDHYKSPGEIFISPMDAATGYPPLPPQLHVHEPGHRFETSRATRRNDANTNSLLPIAATPKVVRLRHRFDWKGSACPPQS